MREAIRRERGYIALALICALLAGVSVFRTAAMRSDTVIEVADFKPPVSALIDINSADISLLISLPVLAQEDIAADTAAVIIDTIQDVMMPWGFLFCVGAGAALLFVRHGRSKDKKKERI